MQFSLNFGIFKESQLFTETVKRYDIIIFIWPFQSKPNLYKLPNTEARCFSFYALHTPIICLDQLSSTAHTIKPRKEEPTKLRTNRLFFQNFIPIG